MPVEDTLKDNINYQTAKSMESAGELKPYTGQYVAFGDGAVVLNSSVQADFLRELMTLHQADVYYCKVSDDGKIEQNVRIRGRGLRRIK